MSLIACDRGPQTTIRTPINVADQTADAELREFLDRLVREAQENPNSPSFRGDLAMAYDANGFKEAAVQTYKQARKLSASEARWPYLESLAYASQGRIEEAVETMDAAIELDRDYVPSYLAKGYWLIDLGEYKQARETFELTPLGDPGDVNARVAVHVGLAKCFLAEGRINDADESLAAISMKETSPYVAFIREQVALAKGGHVDSRSVMRQSGEPGQLSWSDPIAGTVVEYTRGLSGESMLAQRLIDGGRGGDAVSLLESLRQRYRDESHLVVLHGIALAVSDRQEEAIEVLRGGLSEFPDKHLIHFNLGKLLERAGQFDDALSHYDSTISLERSFVQAYDAKAILQINQGLEHAALNTMEESLAHRLPDAKSAYLMGILHGQLGDWENSVMHLSRAVELAPTNVDAYASLILSLSEMGRYDEVQTFTERALELQHDHPKLQRAIEISNSNRVYVSE